MDTEYRKQVESAVKDAVKMAEKNLSILETDARTNGKDPQADAIRRSLEKCSKVNPILTEHLVDQ